jgi:autotransporter-associated beta strand protein
VNPGWVANGQDEVVFVAGSDAGANSFTVALPSSGSFPQTWVKALTVNSGNVTFTGNQANFVLGASSTWTVNTGASLNFSGADGINRNTNSLIVDVQGNGTATTTRLQNSGGSLTKNGTGTLTINGANNYTGATNINDGTLVLSGAANANNSDIAIANSANLTFSATDSKSFTKAISGTAGTVTFNVAGNTSDTGGGDGTNFAFNNTGNAFTGTIVINTGLVSPSGDSAFGDVNNVIQIAGTGGLVATANLSLPSTRAIQLTGTGDRILRVYGGATFTVNGGISGTGNLRKTDGGTTDLLVSGNFKDWPGGGGLTKTGNGVMVLSNANNTYTGVTIVKGGTLQVASTGFLNNIGVVYAGGGGGSGVITQADGSRVTLAGNNFLSVGPDAGITGTYTVGTLGGSSAALTAPRIFIGNNSSTNNGGVGAFTLNSGTVTTNQMDMGGTAAGNSGSTLTINGGTFTDAGQFVVGAHGNTNSVSLTGGSLTTGVIFVAGYSDGGTGTGTFTQDGGTHTTGTVNFGAAAPAMASTTSTAAHSPQGLSIRAAAGRPRSTSTAARCKPRPRPPPSCKA